MEEPGRGERERAGDGYPEHAGIGCILKLLGTARGRSGHCTLMRSCAACLLNWPWVILTSGVHSADPGGAASKSLGEDQLSALALRIAVATGFEDPKRLVSTRRLITAPTAEGPVDTGHLWLPAWTLAMCKWESRPDAALPGRSSVRHPMTHREALSP